MANLAATILVATLFPDPGVNIRAVDPCPPPTICSFNLAHAPIPVIPDMKGYWSQFAEQPTKWQIAYHGYENEDVDGFIAVMDCDRVGQYADITINGSSQWLRVRVFDCMGRNGDPSWWYDNNIIGEIGYPLAKQFNVVNKGGVRGELIWRE